MDMLGKKDCSVIEVGFLAFFAEIAISKTSSDELFSLLDNYHQTISFRDWICENEP
jgi:hypothetical protein